MSTVGASPAEQADGPIAATAVPERVHLLIGLLSAGGAETQLLLLAPGLQRRGIATTVLVMFSGGPHEADLAEAGVKVVPLGFHRRHERWAAVRNVGAFIRLVRLLRRDRPDVLHAFLFHNYVIGAPAARLARVPVMAAGRLSLGHFKAHRPALLAVERLVSRMTDLVIANADAVATEAHRQEGLPLSKMVVVRNGLPESSFAPAEPADLDTALPVVLCVANLHPYKGHRYLIEAAALLRDRGTPVTVVLAGDGVEREALCAQAAHTGVDVRFLGVRRDVERLLARADVAVLPSETEGLSNSVIEAMAAGTPMVATDVGGTAEVLEGRGFLVPPRDARALADALHTVLSDPDGAGKQAEDARRWLRSNLHVDIMVDRHIAAYATWLQRARARRHR